MFLKGGLTTIDTFDLKPDAPAEFRGEFSPIATNVPGIQVGEPLPKLARQMDKFSLLRVVPASQLRPRPGRPLHADRLFPAGRLQPEPDRRTTSGRASGSIIARKLGPRGDACRRMSACRKMHPSARPGVSRRDVLRRSSSTPIPNAPDFAVPDIVPPLALAADRLDEPPRAAAARSIASSKSAEVEANSRAKTVERLPRRRRST